ncbi:hypothetical protein DICVIV_01735 [Dictyocaulus viviparus]|uniref:Uncharacterized protein n=1 Tax=Dictyocaulus viviparus TaxID=29172 RepID=A0A0D8Y7R5_DICVI|nr:hypothetical protein DICVIV_01735 [Dictyocaulus viviparus]
MKECISEQDHYHTFPNKGYAIEEECDLVEIHGQEVAYCICRGHNLCNKAPIAEQFIEFEEKNPELFGDIDLERTATARTISTVPLPAPPPQPARIDFNAPPVPLPPIIPVNDPRMKTSQVVSEIRRAQLPTRERTSDFSESSDGHPPSPPTSEGNFMGGVSLNQQTGVNLATSHTLKSSRGHKGLSCSQCGESNLVMKNSDCNQQVVVNCVESDAVCLTRQILLSEDQAAIEKMCVSWQAVKAEFPMSSMNSCGESNQGRVRYCACNTSECNSIPISMQIIKISQSKILPSLTETSSTTHQPSVTEHLVNSLVTTENPHSPSRMISSIPNHEEFSNDMFALRDESFSAMERNAPKPQGDKSASELSRESSHLSPVIGPQKPIEPVNMPKSALRCFVCVESGISDPTADCSSDAPAQCAVHENFCLTRQTQNDDGTFTMEKRCASETLVISLVESSEARSGCATTKGGLINYCICRGELCNHDGLLAQAQISGVRNPESSRNLQTSSIEESSNIIDPFKSLSTNVPPVFLGNDEVSHPETSTTEYKRYPLAIMN